MFGRKGERSGFLRGLTMNRISQYFGISTPMVLRRIKTLAEKLCVKPELAGRVKSFFGFLNFHVNISPQEMTFINEEKRNWTENTLNTLLSRS